MQITRSILQLKIFYTCHCSFFKTIYPAIPKFTNKTPCIYLSRYIYAGEIGVRKLIKHYGSLSVWLFGEAGKLATAVVDCVWRRDSLTSFVEGNFVGSTRLGNTAPCLLLQHRYYDGDDGGCNDDDQQQPFFSYVVANYFASLHITVSLGSFRDKSIGDRENLIIR